MLPAASGTYLVHAYFDDNEVDIIRANVIGWSVGADRALTPLLVDPRAVDEDGWHVIHPDGRVECADGRCWNDTESWIIAERKRRRDVLSGNTSGAARPARESAPAPVATDERADTSGWSYFEPPPELLNRPTG